MVIQAIHLCEDITILQGDVRESLKTLPSESVQCVVTSPPYFWARDYGVDGQIGHEDTVDEYVATIGAVFDEVKRILNPRGVLYLNLGDTYYSGNGQPTGSDPKSPSRNFMRQKLRAVDRPGWDIPKKSLIGVPWRVALALQTGGWTLRGDIIWNRVNAFVEPTATDRPHRQHEHLFLFSKSRWYDYDRSALVRGEEDVWNIPVARGEADGHNASFPVELARRCIRTATPTGGTVLDPFMGSGTTLYVARQLGRQAVGCELNPEYVTLTARRLNGVQSVLAL